VQIIIINLNFQYWAGQQINYRCKSTQKKFLSSPESGFSTMTITCQDYARIKPWWNPQQLPPCVANLSENKTGKNNSSAFICMG
jgi:hypothetical protein